MQRAERLALESQTLRRVGKVHGSRDRLRIDLAETGIAEAQYNVGRMYAYGEGVTKNYTEAFAWFILSARNGRIEARKAKDELKPHMSPDEIARAYERASELEVFSEWPGS